jgi:hypothetical protein
MATEDSLRGRVAELRAGQADPALRNLIVVIHAAIELQSRISVCLFEAAQDGQTDLAALYSKQERIQAGAVDALVDGLRRHVDGPHHAGR